MYNRNDLAKIRFENAVQCLNSAKLLLLNNDYKSAANRSYYTIFHGIRSVLALDGVDFKKHSAVLSEFRKNYIKTELFPTEFSGIISEIFEIRTDCDYNDFYIISKEEVINQINNAEIFLNEIKKYLQGKEIIFN